MSDDLGRCACYVESGSMATARGGRRYRRCRKDAVDTREITRTATAWTRVDAVPMCATHLKMNDEGRAPRLEGYERRSGR